MMQVKDFYMKTSFLIKIFASHQTPYSATPPVMAKTTILQESEKQNHVLDLLTTTVQNVQEVQEVQEV